MLVELDFDRVMEAGAELARYQVPAGERVLVAHEDPSGTELLDVPADGEGDCFLVDRAMEDGETLRCFVEDYVGQAHRLEACPMGRDGLGSLVEQAFPMVLGRFAEVVEVG